MKPTLLLSAILYTLSVSAQPTISFTFDDGRTDDYPSYQFEDWNNMILEALDKAKIKAAFFVKTNDKSTEKGKYLIDSWDDKGHLIANHTNSHPNFNSPDNLVSDFESELLIADSVIRSYDNYVKLFRFPYLKEGYPKTKADSIRRTLKKHDYKNGYVTIDASDWYIDSRLAIRLKQKPDENINAFRDFYLEHLLERANYYEELALDITGRHINHTLLLHHNLTSALFLSDLISMFNSNGWKVISAQEAYQDPIFDLEPEYAGESLVWALAKGLEKYEGLLRYPAEDSRYEKDQMDKLGL